MNKLQLDFSGGMNVYKAPLVLKDNEAQHIQNYRLNRAGGLLKRAGYLIKNAATSGNIVLQLFQGVNHAWASIINAGSAAATLYYDNSGTWTASSITADSSAVKPHFENFVGYTFRANGADVLASTKTTTWAQTNCPASGLLFQPAYVRHYAGRLYAGGLNSNQAGDLQNRIWWSSLPNPSTNVITWDLDNDWADIDPDRASKITGFEVNGNRLLVFKNNGIFRWQFGSVDSDRVIGVGAFSQELIKTNYELGITFFVSSYGVYSYSPFSEGRPRIISRPIQRWFDAVFPQTSPLNLFNATMELDSENVYISSTATATVDGVTITNPMFVYNVPLDAWAIYTTADPVYAMGNFSLSATFPNDPAFNTPQLFIGDNAGKVYTWNTGNSDNGATIPTNFISKEYLVNFPEIAQLKWFEVFSTNSGNTRSFLNIDRNERWVQQPQLTSRITYSQLADLKCNTLRVQFTDNSVSDSFIEGFNVEYEPQPYHPFGITPR